MKIESESVSRRQFLTSLVMTAGGSVVAALSVLTACNSKEPSTMNTITGGTTSTSLPDTTTNQTNSGTSKTSLNTTTDYTITTSPTVTPHTTNTTTNADPTPSTTASGANESLAEILGNSAGIPAIKYDKITTIDGFSIIQTVYVKKNFMRIEMVSEGSNLVVLVNHSTNRLYNWWIDEKYAMRGKMEAAGVPAPDQARFCLDNDPSIIGTENIDGKVCLKVEYTADRIANSIWIWKQYGMPVRLESGGTIVEYKNYNFSDVSDGIFQFPDDKCALCVNGDLCD